MSRVEEVKWTFYVNMFIVGWNPRGSGMSAVATDGEANIALVGGRVQRIVCHLGTPDSKLIVSLTK